jgi:hypothetical protein
MDKSLRSFVIELAVAAGGAVLLVIVIAFLSIPHHLRGSSGESRNPAAAAPWHPT